MKISWMYCLLLLLSIVVLSGQAEGQSLLENSAAPDEGRTENIVWSISLATYSAASAVDAASSWGGREMNPLLRGGDGRFGARGVAIKAATAGALASSQMWLTRKYGHRKLWTVVNFAGTAVFSYAAARNFGIRK